MPQSVVVRAVQARPDAAVHTMPLCVVDEEQAKASRLGMPGALSNDNALR